MDAAVESKPLRVALVQNCATPDSGATVNALRAQVRAAAARGAQLVALPEACEFLHPDNAAFERHARPVQEHPAAHALAEERARPADEQERERRMVVRAQRREQLGEPCGAGVLERVEVVQVEARAVRVGAAKDRREDEQPGEDGELANRTRYQLLRSLCGEG